MKILGLGLELVAGMERERPEGGVRRSVPEGMEGWRRRASLIIESRRARWAG